MKKKGKRKKRSLLKDVRVKEDTSYIFSNRINTRCWKSVKIMWKLHKLLSKGRLRSLWLLQRYEKVRGHCPTKTKVQTAAVSGRLKKNLLEFFLTILPKSQGWSQHQAPVPKRKRKESGSDGELVNPKLFQRTARHCYGPSCVQTARVGSKYCSDKCGLTLASHRILSVMTLSQQSGWSCSHFYFHQVLPQRIQEWNMTQTVADEHNRKHLEKIRRQQMEARNKLKELDLKHKVILKKPDEYHLLHFSFLTLKINETKIF